MRRLILATLLAISAPALAQDAVTGNGMAGQVQVRLPLVRSVPDGQRVALQIVGSVQTTLGTSDGKYIGADGLVDDISAAQDFRGSPGGSATGTQGPQGDPGAPGKSTYQLWLMNGNEGTVSDFLNSIKGAKGDTGPGPTDNQISAAASTYLAANVDTFRGPKGDQGNSITGPAGSAGANGKSAYQIAVDSGFNGSQSAWLASLKGADGAAGASITGPAGAAGQAATITVGTITTGAAGTSASCSNGGTSSAAVLNCTFPRGATGANGNDGAAGQAATVSVGTVTTLSAGATPTVTNTGTSSAAVLAFGLPRGALFLNDVTLAQTAVVAIALGPRQLTVSTNCVVGDRLFMTPNAALPAGYMLGDAFCSANGTAIVTLYAPLLAIGASYSFTVKMTAFR